MGQYNTKTLNIPYQNTHNEEVVFKQPASMNMDIIVNNDNKILEQKLDTNSCFFRLFERMY